MVGGATRDCSVTVLACHRAESGAAASGVERLVVLSQLGSEPSSPVRFLRYHAAVEQHIRDIGIDAFRNALDGAQPLFDYRLALLKKKFGTVTLDAKVKIANDMVKMFLRVKNTILVSAWTQELARQLQLSERALESEMRKFKEAAAKSRLPEPSAARFVSGDLRPVEKLLLGLLLERPDFLEEAYRSLMPADFENAVARKAFLRMMEMTASGQDISVAHLINFYEGDPELGHVLSLACAEAERAPEKAKAFEDCLLWMKRSRIHGQREELRSQIQEAQREGNQGRIQQLLRAFGELNKGMKRN